MVDYCKKSIPGTALAAEPFHAPLPTNSTQQDR